MGLKRIMLFWAALLVIGCAAVDPARIENGLYINPSYQFSLCVPPGWQSSNDIPVMVKKGMSFVSRRNFKATFSHPQNRCFVLVSAEKTKADWMSFKMYTDKFIIALDQYFSNEKEKLIKKKNIKYYRYEVYRDHIEKCEGDCIASKIDFQVGDLKASGHNILYKGPGGMLYTVSLILVAREETYEAALDVFRTAVDSFEVR